jgi:hypothetical protein
MMRNLQELAAICLKPIYARPKSKPVIKHQNWTPLEHMISNPKILCMHALNLFMEFYVDE